MKPSLIIFLTVLAANARAESPPPLPAPVASFGATATEEGQVYIYGGHAGVRHKYSREEVNGDLYRWQAGMKAWEKLASSEPAQGASLIAVRGEVVRVGGMAAQNAKGEKQDLWSSETAGVYDSQSKAWRPLPKLPERRSSHDSAVVGSTLYVIGGWTLSGGKASAADPTWHGTYLTLDLSKEDATWQSHSQPFKRRALAVQAIGTKVYAIGGMSDGDEPVTHVDVLDTVTGQWTQGPALPADKLGGFGFSAIAHEGRLFASGAPGELLELRNDQWQSIARLAHPRYFHRLVPGGAGKLIALGGESREGKKAPPEVIELPAGTAQATPAKEKAAAPAASTTASGAKATESDWPGYQGPRGNSTTAETGFLTDWPADGPPVAWRTKVGMGLCSFAVVGDHAYTQGNDGQNADTVWCLDLKTGATVWKHTYAVPTKCHEMPIVPYGPAATPTVADGLVYTMSRDGHLLCLKAESGEVVWKRHVADDLGGKRPVYGYASSPTVWNKKLYLDIGGSDKSTTCLDATNGKVVWQTGAGEAGYSTPFVTQRKGSDFLVAFKGEALELRKADDGGLVASHATTTRDFCNCATPILYEDTVFISHTGNMGAMALDWKGSTLTERWNERDVGLLFQSGLPWQQYLMVFNDQVRGVNDLRLIDLKTGKTQWQTKEVAKGSAVMSDDGHVIILTNLGEVVLATLKKDGLDIQSRFQALPAKSWVQPVLSHRHLLLKNNAGEVVCHRL